MTRMSPKTTEAREAVAFMQWVQMHPVLRELMFHVGNERVCTPFQGHQLKLQGVMAGVSDYVLPLAVKPYHGLFLELKRDINCKLTASQDYWLAKVRLNGYAGVVAYGALHAIELTKKYLDGKL